MTNVVWVRVRVQGTWAGGRANLEEFVKTVSGECDVTTSCLSASEESLRVNSSHTHFTHTHTHEHLSASEESLRVKFFARNPDGVLTYEEFTEFLR